MVRHFRDGAVQEVFAQLDASSIRRSFLGSMVPPPGVTPPACDVAAGALEMELPFACAELVDGKQCQARFRTNKQIDAHRQKVHHFANIIRMCTVTNQCAWCGSVLSSRRVAGDHDVRAHSSRVCKVYRSCLQRSVVPLAPLACPLCSFLGTSLELLQQHIVSEHLPRPLCA